MLWTLSHRADPDVLPLADRHYSRQKPGSPQFVPPGRCLVLKTVDSQAYWVTSWPMAEYVKHDWAGAFINSAFRRESGALASDLIIDALKATRWKYPELPELGMISFVDAGKVKPKRNPGYCYIKAGFKLVGKTKGGLLAYQLLPEQFPEAEPPLNVNLTLIE